MEVFGFVFFVLFWVFMAFFKRSSLANRMVNGYIPFIESIAPIFIIKNKFFYSIYRMFFVILYGLFFPLNLFLIMMVPALLSAAITAIMYGLFSILV